MASLKTALVLSGGGSRGAYEIGVWQALKELDQPIDIVTGTSVGALNGAVVTQGSLEQAQLLWRQLQTTHVFDVELDESLPVARKKKKAIALFSQAAALEGGAGTEALEKLLRQYIDETAVRESSVLFGLVTCRLDSLRPVYLWKHQIGAGQLHDYLLASSALYPAIRPREIDRVRYIDGGFADNIPVNMAAEAGAVQIFTVNLRAIGRVQPLLQKRGLRVVEINPYWDLGELLLFEPDRARMNMRLGYLDAMRALGVYDGAAYAFIKGSYHRLARRYASFYDTFGKVLGVGAQGGLLESISCAPLQKRVKRRLSGRLCTVAGLALDGAESAGELLRLDPACLYSLERFDDRLAEALVRAESPEAQRLQEVTAAIVGAQKENGNARLISTLALHPAVFSAALYLAGTGRVL